MIINSYTIRDLYTQTGVFSFSASVLPSNSGVNTFGFSGTYNQNKIEFKLASGKIYDWNSKFVSAYDPTQSKPILFSGTIGSGSVDYYINEEPVAFGYPRGTGYMNRIYTNAYNGASMDFNLFINGNIPDYTLDSFISFNTGDPYVHLTFQNNSPYPFTIFSGDYLGERNLFSFSGIPIGVVSTTKTFNLFPSGLETAGLNPSPFAFYTNFGVITPEVLFSGQVDLFSGLFLELIGPSVVSDGLTGSYSARFTNSGEHISVFPYLKYVSGSGLQTASTILTGYYNITGSGLITGSGNISGLINVTGFGYGGVSQTYSSGILTSGILGFQWATGVQLKTLSIPGTGKGTGINYTGIASGLINVLISGDILNGSGYFYATGQPTGAPSNPRSIYPTGMVRATGAIYYNNPQDYDILYIHTYEKPIIKGYHYTGINDLLNYINTHTSDHFVSGTRFVSSAEDQTIYLTSLLTGVLGNATLLECDSANQGLMEVGVKSGLFQITNDPITTSNGWYYAGDFDAGKPIYFPVIDNGDGSILGDGSWYNNAGLFSSDDTENFLQTINNHEDHDGYLVSILSENRFSFMKGGLSFGLGQSLVGVTPFTGRISQQITGTGIYSQNLTGQILGSRTINDFYKSFTGSWNLQTGFDANSMSDYRQNGWISGSNTYIYPSGKLTCQKSNLFINVSYNAIGTGIDVAQLFLSGFNTNHSVNIPITGV